MTFLDFVFVIGYWQFVVCLGIGFCCCLFVFVFVYVFLLEVWWQFGICRFVGFLNFWKFLFIYIYFILYILYIIYSIYLYLFIESFIYCFWEYFLFIPLRFQLYIHWTVGCCSKGHWGIELSFFFKFFLIVLTFVLQFRATVSISPSFHFPQIWSFVGPI